MQLVKIIITENSKLSCIPVPNTNTNFNEKKLLKCFCFYFSYGSGFIFTTALPPDKVYAAYKSIEILRSEEGQALREQHQANVRQLKTKLIQHGFPVESSPSHIIPILVGLI